VVSVGASEAAQASNPGSVTCSSGLVILDGAWINRARTTGGSC
jgi:hypothetical protein